MNAETAQFLLLILICFAGFIAAYILIKYEWLRGFIVGAVGISMMLIAILGCIVLFTINSYFTSPDNDVVASISFSKIENDRYIAELAQAHGAKSRYQLKGQFWQLEGELFYWAREQQESDTQPAYKLTALRSSYASLEDHSQFDSSYYTVKQSVLEKVASHFIGKELFPPLANMDSSTGILPMRDGALFTIRAHPFGFSTKPENQEAFSASK